MPSTAPRTSTAAVAGVAIFAQEPTELATLYEALLGIEFAHRVHDDGREHFVCALDGVQLEVKGLRTADGRDASDAVGDEAPGTSRAELSISVPDAEAAWDAAIALRFTPHQEPEQYSWGTFGTVIDPEGNRLGLFSPPTGSDAGDDE